jgi:hypothetical protein
MLANSHILNAGRSYNARMALTFDIGDPAAPRGHALLYFRDRDGNRFVATYVLVLPIKMDIGKYLPPLMAAQFGGLAGEAMGEGLEAFAAPPMPEEMRVPALERLSRLRGDDLIGGGDISVDDIAAAMQATAEAVQEYSAMYRASVEVVPVVAVAEANRETDAVESSDVHRVLFELLTERDRVAELAKLVGTLRFATDNGDEALAGESDTAMMALEGLLPEHFWVGRVRLAARDMTPAGESMARLLVERCYRLMDQDFPAVEDLERQIEAAD